MLRCEGHKDHFSRRTGELAIINRVLCCRHFVACCSASLAGSPYLCAPNVGTDCTSGSASNRALSISLHSLFSFLLCSYASDSM
jgi:hypothetical protein